MEMLPRDEVIINRLLKKIEKLKKRVTHYKDKCSAYETVMNSHPRIQRSFDDFQEERQRRSMFLYLEKRVNEQEKLIALLEKQKS